jgi:hypothetical protein
MLGNPRNADVDCLPLLSSFAGTTSTLSPFRSTEAVTLTLRRGDPRLRFHRMVARTYSRAFGVRTSPPPVLRRRG